jgi:transposase-like protein
VKNGSAAGKPKKQWKQCGYQFTRTTPRGKPLAVKINAVLWYLSGVSMNRIAFLLRVSAQAVLTWIKGQRHWFGRFKRKSIIVSKSKEMVDLTMALFAKFWVNGNQDELLYLLYLST